jgi:hypothetical protein
MLLRMAEATNAELIAEEARHALDAHQLHFEALDSKAGVILGFSTAVTALVRSRSAHRPSCSHARPCSRRSGWAYTDVIRKSRDERVEDAATERKGKDLPPFQPDPRLVVMMERGINPRLKKLRAEIEAMIEK